MAVAYFEAADLVLGEDGDETVVGVRCRPEQAGFIGLRLSTGRGSGAPTVMAIFLLAITFSIVAIFSVTFIRKTVGG